MLRFLNPPKQTPLPKGMYHREDQQIAGAPRRIHLRLAADGSGVLILNAATVMHLNPTAAEYAYHYIKGSPAETTAAEVAKRYRTSQSVALADYRQFGSLLDQLSTAQDLDPTQAVAWQRVTPHGTTLAAPLRLDCALTYRLRLDASPGMAPLKRVERELTTLEWMHVLESSWQAGIPHVTFTGGEPTLRDDLGQLIERAEALGQVCGLLTDGLSLSDENYLSSLLRVGLDHILFILDPNSSRCWSGLKAAVSADVFVTVHLNLPGELMRHSNHILKEIADAGAKSISIALADDGSDGRAILVQAEGAGLQLRHDLPVPYSSQNPVGRELAAQNAPSGAGASWLYVEPDGDVLREQGQPTPILGNVLKDSWDGILGAR